MEVKHNMKRVKSKVSYVDMFIAEHPYEFYQALNVAESSNNLYKYHFPHDKFKSSLIIPTEIVKNLFGEENTIFITYKDILEKEKPEKKYKAIIIDVSEYYDAFKSDKSMEEHEKFLHFIFFHVNLLKRFLGKAYLKVIPQNPYFEERSNHRIEKTFIGDIPDGRHIDEVLLTLGIDTEGRPHIGKKGQIVRRPMAVPFGVTTIFGTTAMIDSNALMKEGLYNLRKTLVDATNGKNRTWKSFIIDYKIDNLPAEGIPAYIGEAWMGAANLALKPYFTERNFTSADINLGMIKKLKIDIKDFEKFFKENFPPILKNFFDYINFDDNWGIFIGTKEKVVQLHLGLLPLLYSWQKIIIDTPTIRTIKVDAMEYKKHLDNEKKKVMEDIAKQSNFNLHALLGLPPEKGVKESWLRFMESTGDIPALSTNYFSVMLYVYYLQKINKIKHAEELKQWDKNFKQMVKRWGSKHFTFPVNISVPVEMLLYDDGEIFNEIHEYTISVPKKEKNKSIFTVFGKRKITKEDRSKKVVIDKIWRKLSLIEILKSRINEELHYRKLPLYAIQRTERNPQEIYSIGTSLIDRSSFVTQISKNEGVEVPVTDYQGEIDHFIPYYTNIKEKRINFVIPVTMSLHEWIRYIDEVISKIGDEPPIWFQTHINDDNTISSWFNIIPLQTRLYKTEDGRNIIYQKLPNNEFVISEKVFLWEVPTSPYYGDLVNQYGEIWFIKYFNDKEGKSSIVQIIFTPSKLITEEEFIPDGEEKLYTLSLLPSPHLGYIHLAYLPVDENDAQRVLYEFYRGNVIVEDFTDGPGYLHMGSPIYSINNLLAILRMYHPEKIPAIPVLNDDKALDSYNYKRTEEETKNSRLIEDRLTRYYYSSVIYFHTEDGRYIPGVVWFDENGELHLNQQKLIDVPYKVFKAVMDAIHTGYLIPLPHFKMVDTDIFNLQYVRDEKGNIKPTATQAIYDYLFIRDHDDLAIYIPKLRVDIGNEDIPLPALSDNIPEHKTKLLPVQNHLMIKEITKRHTDGHWYWYNMEDGHLYRDLDDLTKKPMHFVPDDLPERIYSISSLKAAKILFEGNPDDPKTWIKFIKTGGFVSIPFSALPKINQMLYMLYMSHDLFIGNSARYIKVLPIRPPIKEEFKEWIPTISDNILARYIKRVEELQAEGKEEGEIVDDLTKEGIDPSILKYIIKIYMPLTEGKVDEVFEKPVDIYQLIDLPVGIPPQQIKLMLGEENKVSWYHVVAHALIKKELVRDFINAVKFISAERMDFNKKSEPNFITTKYGRGGYTLNITPEEAILINPLTLSPTISNASVINNRYSVYIPKLTWDNIKTNLKDDMDLETANEILHGMLYPIPYKIPSKPIIFLKYAVLRMKHDEGRDLSDDVERGKWNLPYSFISKGAFDVLLHNKKININKLKEDELYLYEQIAKFIPSEITWKEGEEIVKLYKEIGYPFFLNHINLVLKKLEELAKQIEEEKRSKLLENIKSRREEEKEELENQKTEDLENLSKEKEIELKNKEKEDKRIEESKPEEQKQEEKKKKIEDEDPLSDLDF